MTSHHVCSYITCMFVHVISHVYYTWQNAFYIHDLVCMFIQPIPLGVTFSKAQSSKLERLFCHVSVKRDVRALSFELRNSIRKCHPKWDRLYVTCTCSYRHVHVATDMIHSKVCTCSYRHVTCRYRRVTCSYRHVATDM